MIRPTQLLLFLAVLLAGGAAWWARGQDAEASRKPPAGDACRDELTRTKQQLAEAQAEAQKARAEMAAVQEQLDKALHKEHAREKRVQEQLGSPVIDNLK